MRSERIGSDACGLSRRWSLEPVLAGMLIATERQANQIFSSEGLGWPGLFIISGYRSPSLQFRVNPLNPSSLHTRCPSLAVDLRVADTPASVTPLALWAFVGDIWKRLGGRWGGDFPVPDPNHFSMPSISGI